MIETRGYYTEEEIHLEVRWEDPTVDTEPRRWEKTEKGWLLGDGDQDGIAILWSRGGGSFGCQEACHMSDFTLRQGELIDLRSMRMAREEEWEEAWVWKPSQGGQALILDSGGFRLPGSEEPYRRLNSAMAVDDSLSPEARRAGTFAPGDRPLEDGGGRAADRGTVTAPAYLFGGSGEKGGLSVRAERKSDGWHVVFSRALAAGARRQSFRSGETYRFGMAVFDGTSIDHHLVRDTQTLELVRLPATALSKKKRGIVSGPGGEIL